VHLPGCCLLWSAVACPPKAQDYADFQRAITAGNCDRRNGVQEVARGKTSAEIAQILGLTKRTVDFHTDNARGKLGAATRTEAAIKAASGKLIEP